MGRQVFTAGEILTAANMNDLSDQSVMVFDDATARTAAIPTPVEGMLTYLEDVGGAQGLEVFDGSVFTPVAIVPDPPIPPKILQVVSTTVTGTFSTSSGTFVDVTDLAVAITPSAASSKVLIIVNTGGGVANNNGVLRLMRDSTAVGNGTGGSDQNGFMQFSPTAPLGNSTKSASANFLDSPNTTSSTTYKVQASCSNGTLFLGRRALDAGFGVPSTITVMEVAG